MKAAGAFFILIFLLAFWESSVMAADAEIMARCKKQNPEDYTQLEYCIERQEEAKRNLEGRSVSPEIMARCKKQNPEDYTQLEYCIERQEEAKARLGL
jgi:hypothetical protein